MPRGDGTGPKGMGAGTGRSVGYCAGSEMPGYAHPVPGRGFGMGFARGRGAGGRGSGGGGRGWRNMFFATGLPGWMRFGDQRALKTQVEALQSELDFIKKRLENTKDDEAK
ncbi:MAG: DUF5320 domain-containing protein [Candidatus Deferrimicrobium sp.]